MYNNIVIYIVGRPDQEAERNSEMHIFQVILRFIYETLKQNTYRVVQRSL